MSQSPASKRKTILVFVVTILLGFILFALPNLFFGISKFNGGLTGINLFVIALFQLGAICALLYVSLRWLGRDFRSIGLTPHNWKKDSLLGLLVGLSWAALQFGWIIPSTGGAERADIAQMVSMMDGTVLGLAAYIALGVIGGGITEELYNRGYFITVLKDTFEKPRVGLWVAGILSILFFALGHLPANAVEWFDILPTTIAYTLLFVYTGRLTASMVAHGSWNMMAILLTYALYYG
ncbi:lysostaphin resistance A-like protein [Haladaptatus sp. CMAA 1911]|uniref:CPBP family intramembrane glutamic endopeptidase n=1 Tax=unclassified Haladaptatus TaxID=2622732 RepID=UPI0037553698